MLYLGLSVKAKKRLIGGFFRGLRTDGGGNPKSQISNLTWNLKPGTCAKRALNRRNRIYESEYLARCLANGPIKDLIVVG